MKHPHFEWRGRIWRPHGKRDRILLGRPGARIPAEVKIYKKSGGLLTTVTQQGTDNEHVDLYEWEPYVRYQRMRNGSIEAQQFLKVRVKSCYRIGHFVPSS